MLPRAALERADDATRRCDVLIVVGTAAEVYPAAALPHAARQHGAAVIEINPRPTALSADADHVLRGPAGVVLPALVDAVWPFPRSPNWPGGRQRDSPGGAPASPTAPA